MSVCEVKARKGLIRVKVVIDEDRIVNVSITGDFMVLPEDSVFEAESRLIGVRATESEVRAALASALSGASMTGVTVDDFVDAVMCAVRGEKG